MPVKLTAAQLRALELAVTANIDLHKQAKPARKRKPKIPYHSRCARCGEQFTTMAAEERHLIEHRHARFEILP